MNDFELRPATAEDHAFIQASTARSLRSSLYCTDLPDDVYTQVVNGYLQRMLASPWACTIAHPTGYPHELAGFVLHAQSQGSEHNPPRPVVGFLYVAHPYRRQGVATMLLRHATSGQHDFLAVLATPKALGWARDRGLKPQLSPWWL